MKRLLKTFVSGRPGGEQVSVDFVSDFFRILSETPKGMRPEEHFFKQKRQLRQTLAEIRIFQKKMEQYGMEYLLMQKYQVPSESEEMVIEQLSQIESILRILGLKDPNEVYLGRRDLGAFDSDEDMERLFRTLE